MFRTFLRRIASATRRFLLLLLILTGAVCGFVAVAFHRLVELARSVLIEPALALQGAPHFLAVLLVPPLVFMLLAVLVRYFAPAASGANLARVRKAYEVDPAVLDNRSVAATIALTPISLGAGAPLGPEGPTVVVSGGVAMAIARLVRLPRRFLRGMLPVGTAAGIAAIFNTPITGVVFAMEEVMGSASRGVLGGTIVAAVAAAVVERKLLGGRPLLSATPGTWTDVRELAGFLLAGLIAGAVSGSSVHAIRFLRRHFTRIIPSSIARAGIGGLAIGAIGLFVPTILGVGYDTTSLFLHARGSFELASISFAAKVIAFVIALASGILGGVFAPSLFIGAALGATIGHGVALLFPSAHINPGAYALVGMGAFFAGFLRCPISAVLIVVEVTGDYELILPLMLAVAVATGLSRRIAKHSLTELQMVDEGVVERGTSLDPIAGLTVSDVMSKEIVDVTESTSLLDTVRRISGMRHRYYPVIDEDRRVVGLLSALDIDIAARENALEEPAGARMHAARLIVRSSDMMLDAIRAMAEHGVDRCPVVGDDDKLAGFLSPSDLLRARMQRLGTGSEDEVTLL